MRLPWVSETLFFDVPNHMKIRLPYIPSPDWSKGMVTQESDFDHNVSKTAAGIGISSLSMAGAIGKLKGVTSAGSAICGSGVSGEILPAATIRMIGKGEKVSDLIREIAQATYSSGGIEHAIVVLKNGMRCIVKGGPGGVSFDGNVRRILIHTHPATTGPSHLDFRLLSRIRG